MSRPFYVPDLLEAKKSRMYRFIERHMPQCLDDDPVVCYQNAHRFSIEDAPAFWEKVAEEFEVNFHRPAKSIYPDWPVKHWHNYPWFSGAELNFAEHLLMKGKAQDIAIIEVDEEHNTTEYSFSELRIRVARLQHHLGRFIKKGDVVAAYMTNTVETVELMLASTGLGAVFTSTSCDFGPDGVIERFGQSRPKLLLAPSSYRYGGKRHDLEENLRQIAESVESLEAIWLCGEGPNTSVSGFSGDVSTYRPLVEESDAPDPQLQFVSCAFSDPLFIMYSSGTTGRPKCLVHSIGGTLLQHLKEHGLHCDLRSSDRLFYFTTCGWMMWNWLVSGLALGASIVLFDGSPGFQPLSGYLEWVKRMKLSHWGTSPKFLKALEQHGDLRPTELDELKMILSTGSPLLPEQFEWVYQTIKKEVILASIAGGTDIISCFMLGCPMLPVYAGEIQCKGLGMDVACFNTEGLPVVGEEGELVCRTPFVSQPLGLLGDERKEKFHRAYFAAYENVWHHGDYIEVTENGGIKVFGRSDATLNPGGVRIGTAEIYQQTEKLRFIEDSLCVGVPWDGDVAVCLFVKKSSQAELTELEKKEIRQLIRREATPRHSPKFIFGVSDIPYTRSGKKMEMAIAKLFKGKSVDNTAAMKNPECLEEYSVLRDRLGRGVREE